MIPGGYGPWFCGFLVNTGKEPKKHTHVVAHSMPHLIVDALNRTSQDHCWILVLKIGPFVHWKDSVAFLQAWLLRTRGKINRIERGIELYREYHKRYALHLWGQTRHRDDAVNYWRAQVPLIGPVDSNNMHQSMAPEAPKGTERDKRVLYRQWLEDKRDFVSGETLISDLRTFQRSFVLNGSDFLFGWFTVF